MAFLDNTIYTNYALSKISRNIIGDFENFNFLKIKIGSGDNTLSTNRQDLSTLLYSLRIKEVYYQDGIITIKCEIPPELAEIPITEIGLFDTILGVEHLFSYSKVEIIKPSDLGYELTIVLNLGPRTIDFPGVNEFVVHEEEYATRESLNNFEDMFIFMDTNFERIIHSNAKEIGYNMAEIAYSKQLKLNNILKESTYANLYYSLYNMYGSNLTDLFFLDTPNYLSYDILNFANDESFLRTYLDLYDSYEDRISLHDGPVIFAWSMKLNDLSKDSAIFNKKDTTYLYFSIDIQASEEVYKIETDNNGNPVYLNAPYSELIVTIYGPSDTYTLKYVFNDKKKGDYIGQYLPYILTFNGDFEAPEFHLYIDGEEPEKYIAPDIMESKEVSEERKESDLYNKVIYDNNTSALSGMSDYSRRCSLRNYLVDFDTKEKYNYDNSTGTKVLMAVKKQATRNDIAFLSSILRSLGELN